MPVREVEAPDEMNKGFDTCHQTAGGDAPVSGDDRSDGLRESDKRLNPYNKPAPYRYSWTGRPQYSAPGLIEGCLPLTPSIPEHFVEDDAGVWVTFGVPAGHYLYGMYVPVDRAAFPRDVPVERILGNVFRRAAPPVMNQIR